MEQLAELLLGGMTVARFDFTTGSRTLADHQQTLDNLRLAQKATSCMCAVYCSLGGNVFAVVGLYSLFQAECSWLDP